jgi:hypothetical protein
MVDFDGDHFNRYPFTFHIQHYEGTKAITTLRCYPLDHHEKREEIVATLKSRGQNFRRICIKEKGQQMFDYDGDMFFSSERPEDLFGDEYASSVVLAAVLASVTREKPDTKPSDDVSLSILGGIDLLMEIGRPGSVNSGEVKDLQCMDPIHSFYSVLLGVEC